MSLIPNPIAELFERLKAVEAGVPAPQIGELAEAVRPLVVASGNFETRNNRNVANGYAGLDATGKVAATQLPSYVDDVLEFANLAAFPASGEAGKIYTALDTNKIYRWSGSTYVEISASPGSTDAVTEGATNKYFTETRTLATMLAGFSTSSSAVTAADSILSAIGKLQGQVNARISENGGTLKGNLTFSGTGTDERSITWGIGYNIALFGNSTLWGVFDNTNSRFVYRYQQSTNSFIISSKFVIENGNAPASATDAGRAGQIAWDGTYLYLCIAANSWKRVALNAW
jgi:hypothetical protein